MKTTKKEKQKLVVIGNGMAAGRVLEELFKRAADAYEVTIFNAEPRVNYDRIQLSPVLAGEKGYDDLVIHDDDWYERHGVTLLKGEKVADINRDEKRVTSESGWIVHYDKLLIATGSSPFIIPVPGADLPGVVTFRDMDDVEKMLQATEKKGHAVVIGGGLLGLEAAAGLERRGMDVTVLHLTSTLMERQLDPNAAYMLQKEIEKRGINVITRANTEAILGDQAVRSVLLDDGREIAADIVVMAVGIRPNVDLARQAGLETGRGVIVDDQLRTSDPNIFAVGECVEHRGICYGLVAPLYEMAAAVGAQLAGDQTATYEGSLTSTKLKVSGIDLFSAGDFALKEGREEIVLRDAARNIYKCLVLEEDRIVGVVLYGDTNDGAWFFQQMKDKVSIAGNRDTLIFGPAYAGGGEVDPMAAVAALPDETQICGCNGVCKSEIVGAITDNDLKDLESVRAITKASSSCGTCTGLVEQLLALTAGDAFKPDAVPAMCGCTPLSHDDVRRLIIAKELKSIPQLMQELEWGTSCGCSKCRPALNFYLLCAWPGEYIDDGQSRFINERIHANIQKDGTYSVVPRMWGGITNPKELRAIADVADRFGIPTAKVTGGQRIDLLGVKKEDLPAVWAELNAAGMVSGHAYGKSLRTVKTCVGTDWCRFGTQDSTGLGIRLERFLWGSWTPHKLKLAVSGCPRNCAEATCKDVGVVCVEGGYEIHFGGAAGMHVKETEVLCLVETEEEVLEHCGALVQMYREQARYLERIYKWSDRVGVDFVRRTIVEDVDSRAEYLKRFLKSQENNQNDPWAARVEGVDAHEFAPLSELAVSESA